MAESITLKDILAEIPKEDMSELLTSVQLQLANPMPTHIQTTTSSLIELPPLTVLEIQGPAASGKTHLLYHLLITCVTPHAVQGWDKSAILYDSDNTFNILRFNQLLVSRLARFSLPRMETFHMANRCIARLHIFKPTSSQQLAASLLYLPSYHANHMPDDEIGLIAIDSLSAFYWQDKLMVERMRDDHGWKPPTSASAVSPLQHVLSALQGIRRSYGCITMWTNWGLIPLTKSTPEAPSVFYKQHLEPSPSSMILLPGTPRMSTLPTLGDFLPSVTHHMTLHSAAIPSFADDTTLEEAKKQEMNHRSHLVQLGEVFGALRTIHTEKMEKFSFFVGDSEITLERL